ncbi:MAG TPA: glutamine synthetase family protein [Terriglobales bacterium]|nr:glutamine synthetase family protein [Terriglobales bacterium]
MLVTSSSPLPLASPLVTLLDKPAADFTRDNLLRVISEKQIEQITFHYTAIDGKLKELRLPISTIAGAEQVLAEGERVDGSSLFNGVVERGASDLYVVPLYRSAFLNPFEPGSLDFICRYFDRHGNPAAFAPDNVLHRAAANLKQNTGLDLRALGELEFYLIGDHRADLYKSEQQRGYHASAPFVKNGEVVAEMIRHLEQITGAIKYGHGEVGWIGTLESDVAEISGKTAEQFEIEFLPIPVEDCADALVIARWIIRNVAYRHGLIATFTPKLEEGAAGSGMHFHLELARNGRNVVTTADGSLSTEALTLIGGLCNHADVLTVFGNTVASSYLRLVPDQEAPTRICWSDMNRSALIRVPLAWNNIGSLSDQINPPAAYDGVVPRQTVELRTPDGSALIHMLLAGIAVVADHAFDDPSALAVAKQRYITSSGLNDEQTAAGLPRLPRSCAEAASLLERDRELFQRNDLFPAKLIDYVVSLLLKEEDGQLARDLRELGPQQRTRAMRKIMHRDLHRH